MRFNSPATNAQLEEVAPAIFSTKARNTTSDLYQQVPTIDVLDRLSQAGYGVSFAQQKTARSADTEAYARHLVKLRPLDLFDTEAKLGAHVPEVVIVNAHDATTSYQVFGGVFRFVCANGMMVGDQMVASQRVTHRGDAVAEVHTATQKVWEGLDSVAGWITKAQGVEWDRKQQLEYAARAGQIRYGDDVRNILDIEQLLRVRRPEDEGRDVWRVFNRVQENLLQGGQRTTTATGRNSTSRPVARVTKSVTYNRALWDLTAEMLDA